MPGKEPRWKHSDMIVFTVPGCQVQVPCKESIKAAILPPDAADVSVPKTALTLRPHTELFEESVRHGRFQGNEPMTSCILQYPRPLKPVMWGSQYQLAISKLQVLYFPSGCASQPVCELGYTRRKTGVAITLARSPNRLGLDVQYLLKNKCG